MADQFLKNPNLVVDSDNWSAQVKSMKFTPDRRSLNATASSTAETEIDFKGLKFWMLEVVVKLDAAGQMEGWLWDIFNNGVAVEIVFSHAGATETAANAEYTGFATMGPVDLINGNIGDLQETTVVFTCAGAVARDVT